MAPTFAVHHRIGVVAIPWLLKRDISKDRETAQRIRGKQGLPWAGKGHKRRAQWVGGLRGEGLASSG